jgi:hypothetical protein
MFDCDAEVAKELGRGEPHARGSFYLEALAYN